MSDRESRLFPRAIPNTSRWGLGLFLNERGLDGNPPPCVCISRYACVCSGYHGGECIDSSRRQGSEVCKSGSGGRVSQVGAELKYKTQGPVGQRGQLDESR